MVRPAVRLLSLLALLAMSACAALEDAAPPEVSLADITFLRSGLLEQEIEVELRLRNPNNFELPLEGLTFDLLLDGKQLVRGFSNESVTIPRLGEARLPVTASTNLIDLVQQALRIARSGQLDYRIVGQAYVSGLGNRSMPYDKSGRLRLLPAAGSPTTETLIPL
jgi:LEA14-like dessication related protein